MILPGLFLLPGTASGQNDPSQPAVLPDIAPQEVEIRGQLEIQFPSLQRQPLVGFNPPPRVVPIPPDRQPWVDAYKQEKADLPPSPVQPPQPPEVSALRLRTPQNGEIEGSFGRYFSRLVRARTEWAFTPGVALYARVDYRGTAGHDPDYLDQEEVDASFDAFDGVVGLQANGRGMVFGAEVDGLIDAYSLYGTEMLTALSEGAPEREGQGLGGAVWLRTQGASNVDGHVRLHFSHTDYETGGASEVLAEKQEQRFTVTGALALPASPVAEARLEGDFSAASLRDDATSGMNVRHGNGMAGIRFRAGQTLDLTLGLRALSFLADAQNFDDRGRSATYLTPDVRLNLHAGRNIMLFARNRPGLDANTLEDLFRRNPYLVAAPVVRPTIRTVDAEAGATVFIGPVEFEARAGYVRAPNYLFFEHASSFESDPFAGGLSTAHYASARIAHLGGDVSVLLPAGFNATAGVTYRRGRLLDDDTAIPYFGPFVGRASLSYAFLDNRGLLQLSGTYEGARYRDREQTRRLADFVDIDLALTYDVSPSLGIVVRAENLSPSPHNERWDRYEQPPFTVMGGFRVLW